MNKIFLFIIIKLDRFYFLEKKLKAFFITEILMLLMFLILSILLLNQYIESEETKNEYEELELILPDEPISDVFEESSKIDEAWISLFNINSHIIGCIKAGKINYPVVQYQDNEYYLRKNIYEQKNRHGVPFLDALCSKESQQLIIYAHNMRDGTMFAPLLNYIDKDFYEENETIIFNTPEKNGVWQVFSAYTIDIEAQQSLVYDTYRINFSSDEDFLKTAKRWCEQSVFESDVEFSPDDKILTLSTCSYEYDNARFVVHAKLIDNQNIN